MHRILAEGFVLLVLASAAEAGTYYVAADGKPHNDGSRDKPWPSVEFALQKVGGGNTIVVRPGIYRGPITVAHAYAGTKERPTVVRSEEKWRATMIGAPGYGGMVVADNCDWVTIEGFEVFGAQSRGVALGGSHNTVRDCWIHHNCWVGVGMGGSGGVIENNLIEFNGGHVQFDHGIYASGDHMTIRGNIVRHNSSFGLHLYDHLSDSLVAQNLVYGNRSGAVIVRGDGGPNRIVHNTILDGLALWNPGDDLVANNILVGTGDPIAVLNPKQWHADYNLCWPNSKFNGPHGVGADPAFVEASMGVYWLRKDSPAIGKGSKEYALPTDFWGRLTPKDKPPDLGAFAYEPSLLEPQTRAQWHCGWGYGRVPGLGLFVLPQAAPSRQKPATSPSPGKP